jgi:UDP:flavonoid glycosyltransferase YjiC (YdhE family)
VTEQAVECTLERYRHVVQTFKPDILVGDTNLLLWILAREVSLPVAQIVRYASHPKTAKMIWWESEPVGMIPPNSADLFNQILSKMGLKPINRAEDLLEGDLYLIPSIHEIEPVPLDEKTFHVGELTLSESEGEAPIWFEAMNNGQPLVYVTIGGGAGNVGNKLFFSTIIKAFSNKNIQVVVSTSSKFNPQDFTNLPPNIHFFEWVPGKFLISKANLVVFHGGYGTMMESIACGKPTVTIPFHSEQEGNGRRLEQAGCGRVVKLSRENYKQIEGKWKYGKYSYLVQNRYDLRPEELFENVDKILFKAEYLHNAQRLQSKLKEYHGAVKTLDLLEKHLR